MPASLADLVASLYGGGAAPAPVATQSPGYGDPAPVNNQQSPVDPIVKSNGEVLARLKSAQASQQPAADTPAVYSGLPDVTGKSKWGAFATGLGSGLKDSARQSQLEAQMRADASTRNFQMLSTLFNAQRGVGQDQLAQDKFGYEQKQGDRAAQHQQTLDDIASANQKRSDMMATPEYIQKATEAKAAGTSSESKVQQIGEDQYGRKKYGVFDPDTGKITPVEPAAGDEGAPAAMDLHGDDFMKTLDPQTAGQVKAIVEGRAPYPTGMLLHTPYGQKLATYVTQADPSFEAGNATARVKTRNEFLTGGPSSPAGMITAGNTAIQHLGHLSDAAESLGNWQIPAVNAIGNSISQAAGAGTAVTQFNNILGKYVEEATKFYRGTGGTEADIQRDLGNLSPNMSPPQLRTALQTQVELLQSKINALQDRWRQGMGSTLGKDGNPMVPDFPIVQKDSAGALEKIAKRAGIAPSNVPGAAAPASPGTPNSGDIIKGYRFKGGDPSQQQNWEAAQ